MEPIYQAGNWNIELHQSSIGSSDLVSNFGAQNHILTPCMLFYDSFVRLTNSQAGLTYDINSLDALKYCSDSVRQASLYSQGDLSSAHINVNPVNVKVADASAWVGKKVPKNTAFVEEGTEFVELQAPKTSDWTFTSPYKGLLHQNGEKLVQISPDAEDIPLGNLGPSNPILWFGEVLFYMDDLEDCGQSTFNFRIRAMKDCFFGLLRSYIRVDNVLLRILDTRIYHQFNSSCILREFQYREVTFSELETNGTPFQTQWTTETGESDLVYEYMPLKFAFKDRVDYASVQQYIRQVNELPLNLNKMDRLSLRLPRAEGLQPYCCKQLLGKSFKCACAAFSPCYEYLVVGTSANQLFIYSILTHSIILRYQPAESPWGKTLSVKWTPHTISLLTDQNTLYTLSDDLASISRLDFDFKVLGFDKNFTNHLVFGKKGLELLNGSTRYPLHCDAKATEWFGCFSNDKIVALGSPNNTFYIFDLAGQLQYSQEVSSIFPSTVRSFLNYNNLFVLNSGDRLLRLFELKEPTQFLMVKEIGDYVERKKWSACCFFKCRERESIFILATLHENGSHTMRMFDTVYADQRVNFAKNMQSPLGSAIQLISSYEVHLHPVIVVVTQTGSVLLWASESFHMKEKWSTSLGIPNFVELVDGNVYHEETEDQYDKQGSEQMPLDLNPRPAVKPFRVVFY